MRRGLWDLIPLGALVALAFVISWPWWAWADEDPREHYHVEVAPIPLVESDDKVYVDEIPPDSGPLTIPFENVTADLMSFTGDDITAGPVMEWSFNTSADPERIIDNLRGAELLDRVIKILIETQEFCRVVGHQWEYGTQWTATLSGGSFEPDGTRICNVCETTQEKVWR